MTEKQIQRIKDKIDRIKKTLAAEKKMYGGYDDSRGLRYMPPELYLKMGDYPGAGRYFTWFKKNFPDDVGFPQFLFEWTVTLFKNKKYQDAERKAYETYFCNTYVFEKFLTGQVTPIDKEELAGYELPGMMEDFPYAREQKELTDFAQWLRELVADEAYQTTTATYVHLQQQLQSASPGPKRNQLLAQSRALLKQMP